jgi:hypothetical protein
VRDRIVAEARSNPLALLELPRGLRPAQLAGGFGLAATSTPDWRVRPTSMRSAQRSSPGGSIAAVLHNGLGSYDSAFAAQRACGHDDLGLFGWTLIELVEAGVRTGNPDTAAATWATSSPSSASARAASWTASTCLTAGPPSSRPARRPRSRRGRARPRTGQLR